MGFWFDQRWIESCLSKHCTNTKPLSRSKWLKTTECVAYSVLFFSYSGFAISKNISLAHMQSIEETIEKKNIGVFFWKNSFSFDVFFIHFQIALRMYFPSSNEENLIWRLKSFEIPYERFFSDDKCTVFNMESYRVLKSCTRKVISTACSSILRISILISYNLNIIFVCAYIFWRQLLLYVSKPLYTLQNSQWKRMNHPANGTPKQE